MAETIELSEAIRSILGEDATGKENYETEILPDTPKSNSILSNMTWGPRHTPGKGSGKRNDKRWIKSEYDTSPPQKKRRHINEVILLRNPRRKSKPSPEVNTGSRFKESSVVKQDRGNTSAPSTAMMRRHTVDGFDFQESYDRKQDSGLGEQLSDAGGQDPNVPIEKSSQLKWNGKGKSRDDSLTNITWLRRMSAPDLDPTTLQTSKASSPPKERPPYSYSTLIQFAISTAPSGRMTLREIYHWIEVHFPYFRTAKLGWRNSIRHNLSLHKIFVREPPVGHGQPAFWTLQPGTIVRLPEKTMFVAQGTDDYQPSTSTDETNQSASKKKTKPVSQIKGKEDKKKKEQYILPRVEQPLALVPVPIFITTESGGTQLVTSPLTGEPILSPIPINLLPEAHLQSMFASGHRKHVKIAPKVTFSEPSNSKQNGSGNRSMSLQSTFPNATFSNTSSLRDSGFGTDVEGSFNESQSTSSQQIASGASTPSRRDLPIKKRSSPWNGNRMASSTPHRKAFDNEHMGDMPDMSIFDELPNFEFTPKKTPNGSGKRKSSALSRSMSCPDWLSPIRGYGDNFTSLREDLTVTPPRTGLTPKNRSRTLSSAGGLCTPKSQRSPALGSLGDLGLSGLTPERIADQSFGKMFGGDMCFDMDAEGLGYGNYWSIMSPVRH